MSEFATREDFANLGQMVEAMTSAVTSQTAVMQQLAEAMTDQRHVESARATGGRAEMHVSGGGVALWLCVTFSAVQMVCTIFLLAAVFWFALRTNDQGHQMNAMYQSIPGLRELVDRQMTLIDRTNKPPTQEPKQ